MENIVRHLRDLFIRSITSKRPLDHTEYLDQFDMVFICE